MNKMNELRLQLNEVNHQLLKLLNARAEFVQEIGFAKEQLGLPKFDPEREQQMLDDLISLNKGPFSDNTIRFLFKEIFKASLDLQQHEQTKKLLVSRKMKNTDTIIEVKGVQIGGGWNHLIAGPCSVESIQQMRRIASELKDMGIQILRAGAYKPRTSPYDFQGLEIEGLKILKEVAEEFHLITVSEVTNPRHLDFFPEYVDILQIGARNMQNFELLKAVGESNTPVLLKRGIAATLEEYLLAAEYIISRGNPNVMLIERGIRTYEKWTRNTLDISAVPILKRESHLPVFVDVSHSTGRKDIVAPCAKAALAAGADGIMVEVHPNPSVAMSDAHQQLNIDEFKQFWEQLHQSGLFKPCKL
ncbi:bifunctional 3-deoxy-7-phosphoheptulonate synthase/chorismate mutase [Paenibacillus tarimensis]